MESVQLQHLGTMIIGQDWFTFPMWFGSVMLFVRVGTMYPLFFTHKTANRYLLNQIIHMNEDKLLHVSPFHNWPIVTATIFFIIYQNCRHTSSISFFSPFFFLGGNAEVYPRLCLTYSRQKLPSSNPNNLRLLNISD